MKKLVLVVLALLVASNAFAITFYGTRTTLRDNVALDDQTVPATTAGVAPTVSTEIPNAEGNLVEIWVSGANASWTVIPLYLEGDGWASGSVISTSASGSALYTIPSYGKTMYFMVQDKAGTDPQISIYVTPYAEKERVYTEPKYWY